MSFEILYYTNGRGGSAVSVDGGEHVVVSTGRSLLLVDTPVWEEANEEDCVLSPKQQQAVQEAVAEWEAQSEEQAELSEIVLNYRKRRLIDAKRHPTKPRKIDRSS